MDMYSFYKGQSFDAYEYLGAHPGENGITFRTFAPNASTVSLLLGGKELAMNAVYDGNFYELCLPNAEIGQTYEYRIYMQNGSYCDHADPYGFESELRPAHKSIICDLSSYHFSDDKWMKRRTACYDKPLNIYEIHLGSWRRREDGEMLGYRELVTHLIPYLKEAGYNYVEFLPLCEHPCDESWGYQSTGFFAPTKRYGRPQELMEAIDLLHKSNIGVILDFVPVHFATDSYGLGRYDGSALYEYPNDAVGVSEWGSYNFMHSRGEVRSFLQSSADFFFTYYHFDGIRMDAISRILYWQGDEKRGENGNAIDFIKVMNMGLHERHRGIMMIAEDSTSYKGVTENVSEGGLGFDYKWDMGWMHDTLQYFRIPPNERTKHYHKLTFSMMYFRNERYLLPYSHDEVVHGKATILQKMNGEYEDKFPQARAMYLYMAVHPGKKLNFMGNEFGQLREWDEKREQDFDLGKYPTHNSFYRFMCELNAIYLERPALSASDYDESGFEWLDCHCEAKCIYAIGRKSEGEKLIALFNFGDKEQEYILPIREEAKIILHTDWEKYGGNTPFTTAVSGSVWTLPRFSGILIRCE